MSIKTTKGLLERLAEGVVVGDGGLTTALEKRGYVKAGPWTPEISKEHPEALRQIHREFVLAGAEVVQSFTFNNSKISITCSMNEQGGNIEADDLNKAAFEIASAIRDESDILVAACISQTQLYSNHVDSDTVKANIKRQLDNMMPYSPDFLVAEFFKSIEEMEYAIEVMKTSYSDMPVCATMPIGAMGDAHGVSIGECAVRMAKAGADVVGLNCCFGPIEAIENIKLMKMSLDEAGLKPHLMTQPAGFHTPDADATGYSMLPEFPYAMEPRQITRWDARRYAREAYDLGVRYIGGCCGFEAYHIRAISIELQQERGGYVPPSAKKDASWEHSSHADKRYQGSDYWMTLKPATGRPDSAAFTCFPNGIHVNNNV